MKKFNVWAAVVAVTVIGVAIAVVLQKNSVPFPALQGNLLNSNTPPSAAAQQQSCCTKESENSTKICRKVTSQVTDNGKTQYYAGSYACIEGEIADGDQCLYTLCGYNTPREER